jgi:hypothetical protein
VSSNWVTPKMRVYAGRGAVFSDNQVTIKSGEFKGCGRGYYLDAKALLKTFVEILAVLNLLWRTNKVRMLTVGRPGMDSPVHKSI